MKMYNWNILYEIKYNQFIAEYWYHQRGRNKYILGRVKKNKKCLELL